MSARCTDHHHDDGLHADLARLLVQPASRRQSLRWLLAGAGGAVLPLAGCGGGGEDGSFGISTSTTTTGSGSTGSAACSVIPEETGGPYPGDGTNRNANGVANALILTGIVRSDIRASVAGASGVAQGVPLTIRLKIENVAGGCAAAAGAAVYLWHCTREGGYSMYSNGIVGENYLRGVQEADSDGWVTFTTIFPGCYDGAHAACALRGLSDAGKGGQRGQPHQDLAVHLPAGDVERSLHRQRLYQQREQPGAHQLRA